MKITFLGTGTSHGVPSIDCMLNNFERCKKKRMLLSLTDPKHNRTRSSILVEYNGKHISLTYQPISGNRRCRERIPKIDAGCLSHTATRTTFPAFRYPFVQRPRTPRVGFLLFTRKHGIHTRIFSLHIFAEDVRGGGIPRLALHPVDKPFILFDAPITPLPLSMGA